MSRRRERVVPQGRDGITAASPGGMPGSKHAGAVGSRGDDRIATKRIPRSHPEGSNLFRHARAALPMTDG